MISGACVSSAASHNTFQSSWYIGLLAEATAKSAPRNPSPEALLSSDAASAGSWLGMQASALNRSGFDLQKSAAQSL